jgi:hypothetical protein
MTELKPVLKAATVVINARRQREGPLPFWLWSDVFYSL